MRLTDETLKEELTVLTNKVYAGDPTVLVYEILSETQYIPELIQYLSGGAEDASDYKPSTSVREECGNRPSVEEWLARRKVL